MIEILRKKYDELSQKFPLYAKLVRFLISGGTAAFTNIALLYFFTDILKVWYILSAMISFCLAFIVSFTLQKYWTFQDSSSAGVRRQAIVYFTVAAINLGLNTILLYSFVEYFGVHYILSQLVASALIAIESYFIYQIFIFSKKSVTP